MNFVDILEQSRIRFLKGIGVPKPSPFVVDQFQKDAIENITGGFDTLVVAPTGSGKTFIAFESIRACLMQRLKAVYTTPLKALSNTKFNDLKSKFEPEFKVGLLTGDRKIDCDGDVVVATTEIYRNELYSGSEERSLVVLDEVHFIADQQRGAVWEESIILSPRSSTLLMLSASISNPEEIAEWISEVRQKECKIVIKEGRPVELRYGFLHPEYGVLPLRDESGALFKEVSRFYSRLELDRSGTRLKFQKQKRGRNRRREEY